MKKIAILSSGFAPVPAVRGGAVEMLTTILIEQNSLKNLFFFDVYTLGDKALNNYRYDNCNIIQINVNPVQSFFDKLLNKIFRILHIRKEHFTYNKKLLHALKKKNDYDYILFENNMNIYASVYELYGNKTKYILHLHNDFNDSSKSSAMANMIFNTSYKILTVSKYIGDKYLSIVGSRFDNKIRVLYNCEDILRLNYDDDEKNRFRNKYNISEEDFVFLYVGRINGEKGVLELAQAFGKIKINNVKLIICGGTWGDEFRENKYLTLVRNALGDNKNRTVFTGYADKDRLREIYSISDTVIIPSICNEAFGMVMLEAVSYGIPVIATNSGGMVEIPPTLGDVDWVDINSSLVDNLYSLMKLNIKNKTQKKERAQIAQKKMVQKKEFKPEGYLERFCELIE